MYAVSAYKHIISLKLLWCVSVYVSAHIEVIYYVSALIIPKWIHNHCQAVSERSNPIIYHTALATLSILTRVKMQRNIFKSNQIWIVITLLRLIRHQTEFLLVPIQSEKGNTILSKFDLTLQNYYSTERFAYNKRKWNILFHAKT